MLKCEINRSLVTQCVDIYLFTEKEYFSYNSDCYDKIQRHEYKRYMIDGLKPFLSLPYDIADKLFKNISEDTMNRKLEDGTALSAKEMHIKDLNKILDYFMEISKNETNDNNLSK